MKLTIEISEDNIPQLLDDAQELFDVLSIALEHPRDAFESARRDYAEARSRRLDASYNLEDMEAQLRYQERVAALLIPPMKALADEVNAFAWWTGKGYSPLSTATFEEDLERSRAMMKKVHAELAGETDDVG